MADGCTRCNRLVKNIRRLEDSEEFLVNRIEHQSALLEALAKEKSILIHNLNGLTIAFANLMTNLRNVNLTRIQNNNCEQHPIPLDSRKSGCSLEDSGSILPVCPIGQNYPDSPILLNENSVKISANVQRKTPSAKNTQTKTKDEANISPVKSKVPKKGSSKRNISNENAISGTRPRSSSTTANRRQNGGSNLVSARLLSNTTSSAAKKRVASTERVDNNSSYPRDPSPNGSNGWNTVRGNNQISSQTSARPSSSSHMRNNINTEEFLIPSNDSLLDNNKNTQQQMVINERSVSPTKSASSKLSRNIMHDYHPPPRPISRIDKAVFSSQQSHQQPIAFGRRCFMGPPNSSNALLQSTIGTNLSGECFSPQHARVSPSAQDNRDIQSNGARGLTTEERIENPPSPFAGPSFHSLNSGQAVTPSYNRGTTSRAATPPCTRPISVANHGNHVVSIEGSGPVISSAASNAARDIAEACRASRSMLLGNEDIESCSNANSCREIMKDKLHHTTHNIMADSAANSEEKNFKHAHLLQQDQPQMELVEGTSVFFPLLGSEAFVSLERVQPNGGVKNNQNASLKVNNNCNPFDTINALQRSISPPPSPSELHNNDEDDDDDDEDDQNNINDNINDNNKRNREYGEVSHSPVSISSSTRLAVFHASLDMSPESPAMYNMESRPPQSTLDVDQRIVDAGESSKIPRLHRSNIQQSSMLLLNDDGEHVTPNSSCQFYNMVDRNELDETIRINQSNYTTVDENAFLSTVEMQNNDLNMKSAATTRTAIRNDNTNTNSSNLDQSNLNNSNNTIGSNSHDNQSLHTSNKQYILSINQRLQQNQQQQHSVNNPIPPAMHTPFVRALPLLSTSFQSSSNKDSINHSENNRNNNQFIIDTTTNNTSGGIITDCQQQEQAASTFTNPQQQQQRASKITSLASTSAEDLCRPIATIDEDCCKLVLERMEPLTNVQDHLSNVIAPCPAEPPAACRPHQSDNSYSSNGTFVNNKITNGLYYAVEPQGSIVKGPNFIATIFPRNATPTASCISSSNQHYHQFADLNNAANCNNGSRCSRSSSRNYASLEDPNPRLVTNYVSSSSTPSVYTTSNNNTNISDVNPKQVANIENTFTPAPTTASGGLSLITSTTKGNNNASNSLAQRAVLSMSLQAASSITNGTQLAASICSTSNTHNIYSNHNKNVVINNNNNNNVNIIPSSEDTTSNHINTTTLTTQQQQQQPNQYAISSSRPPQPSSTVSNKKSNMANNQIITSKPLSPCITTTNSDKRLTASPLPALGAPGGRLLRSPRSPSNSQFLDNLCESTLRVFTANPSTELVGDTLDSSLDAPQTRTVCVETDFTDRVAELETPEGDGVSGGVSLTLDACGASAHVLSIRGLNKFVADDFYVVEFAELGLTLICVATAYGPFAAQWVHAAVRHLPAITSCELAKHSQYPFRLKRPFQQAFVDLDSNMEDELKRLPAGSQRPSISIAISAVINEPIAQRFRNADSDGGDCTAPSSSSGKVSVWTASAGDVRCLLGSICGTAPTGCQLSALSPDHSVGFEDQDETMRLNEFFGGPNAVPAPVAVNNVTLSNGSYAPTYFNRSTRVSASGHEISTRLNRCLGRGDARKLLGVLSRPVVTCVTLRPRTDVVLTIGTRNLFSGGADAGKVVSSLMRDGPAALTPPLLDALREGCALTGDLTLVSLCVG